jgi:hypothetical protein
MSPIKMINPAEFYLPNVWFIEGEIHHTQLPGGAPRLGLMTEILGISV